jgi:phosphoglucosamine mutase
MDRLPQVLVNVKGVDKARVAACEPLTEAVRAAEAELGTTGRVLLRPSGTEPLVRVMVEAGSADQARAVAEDLAAIVRRELTLS